MVVATIGKVEMITPRTEKKRWIEEEAARRLAAEVGNTSDSGAVKQQVVTSVLRAPPSLRRNAPFNAAPHQPPPLPSRESRGLSSGGQPGLTDQVKGLKSSSLSNNGGPTTGASGGAYGASATTVNYATKVEPI